MNREKIIQLLAEVLQSPYEEIASLSDDTGLEEMGMDSIRFIQFIVRLEEEEDIEVLDSDLLLSNFSTIDTILHTMQKYEKNLKKALILDCDGVLWHGVAGEEPLTIDEKIINFQNTAKQLSRKGVLLCLCSRNAIENLREAFSSLDTPLQMDDFVVIRSNVIDKADALSQIAKELKILTESFVFADDSDYELGLVETMLPEIETVKIDYNNTELTEELELLFKELPETELDRVRLHREQKEREKVKINCKTPKEYNDSLKTVLQCRKVGNSELARIAELSQRTNQCNLSAQRYTESELQELYQKENIQILSLSASDRYGDMGLVGACVLCYEQSQVIIESFFLSCRVFDRGFEEFLLEYIKKLAKGNHLVGVFRETTKNSKYSNFYSTNGVEVSW